MRYAVAISIAILFLITSITYIIYLCWYYPTANVQTGLNNATLRTWPKLTYAEAMSLVPQAVDASYCPICLEDYEEEEEKDKSLRLLPEFRHLFDATCVDTWLRRRPTCPVCRSLVVNGAMPMPLSEGVSLAIEHA